MSATLIVNAAVLTRGGWVDRGYVWVQDGKIAAIGSGEPPPEASASTSEILNACNCAVMPGLTNAHTHLSQTFMRGLAGGRSLIDWLKQLIWPLQSIISVDELYLAALLGLVENLRGGVTDVTDHHKITKTKAHTDAVLKAAKETKLRFTLARAWSDIGQGAEPPQQIIDDLTRLFEFASDEKLVSIANGPLALWRCSTETLKATHALALQNRSFTHFHVSESQQEVALSLEAYDQRPVTWLDSISVLDSHTQIVHAVWLDADEIKLVKARNAPVVHCPVSNAVMGSGVAPLAAMLQEGIHICLGTDGAASNDTQDVWETLKFTVGVARAVGLDPTILQPGDALSLATLGRSLTVGSPADLIIVNLNHARVVPVADYDSALVLGTHGSDVQTVMIAGEILMKDGRITILDEEALLAECRQAADGLRRRTGIISAGG